MKHISHIAVRNATSTCQVWRTKAQLVLQETLRQMPGELAAQEQHVREMDKVLRAGKGHWKCERRSMVRAYVQHCVLPRATYSPADAAFCAAFMQRLVRMSVPWFPAFLYLDTVGALLPASPFLPLFVWSA